MKKAIEFINVSKKFDNTGYFAVNDVSCEIGQGEFITILGSSGCGKTTLLKMVNRLYEPDKGSVKIFGEDISSKDPVLLRREIGYVIQQVGLFPHMNIGENIATVPRLLKWPEEKINERVQELLEMVGLSYSEYGKRYPSQLSGGQQQRAGLARALCADPRIMLMDEPFGAIDAINRMNLQEELQKIHRESKKTFLFVTHDINEAFKLGSRVIIMNEGKIRQFDKPENIVRNPSDEFVKSLIDSTRKQEQFWEAFT